MSQVQAVHLSSPSEGIIPGRIKEPEFRLSDEALVAKSVVINVKKQWDKCLKAIEKEIPHQTIQTWFRQITPVFFVDDLLFLQIPSQFFSEWIETHYGEILRKSVINEFGENASVQYLIAPIEEAKSGAIPTADAARTLKSASNDFSEEKEPLNPRYICRDLDHRFQFDNFFVGRENELAYNAAQLIAEKLISVNYNPFILYGETGTGKSHLSHALGNAVQKLHPELKLAFITSDRFIHGYVQAAQEKTIGHFSKPLMDANVFILEDIQLLAGKEKSQEELLFILSELFNKKAQIIITSTVSPNQLKLFNKRLISFLQKGLITDIPPCDFHTRETIIRHFLNKHEVYLDEKIIQFLAENLNQNIHNLHSIMVRVIAQTSLTKRALSLGEIKYIISQICPDCYQGDGLAFIHKEVGIDEIVTATAGYFRVPADMIQGVSRKQKIARARQIALYLCRELTGESLNCIGHHFSNLHHASVLYAYNKLKQDIEKNPQIRSAIQKIKALL